MNKLHQNYLYNLLYQIFILLVPLLTAPYLARVLGAESLGVYGYVYSFTSIISSLTLLGIYSYGNRQTAYVRDHLKDLNQFFWEIMILRIVLGIIGSSFFFILAHNLNYGIYFLFYYGWFLATILDVSWIFVGIEKMKPVVLKNFYAKLATVVGIFIFIKEENDLYVYFLIVSLTTLIANLSVYNQLRKVISKPSIRKKNITKHLKGSLNLFLPQVAALLYLQVDKIMIQYLTKDTSQVAFYDQAEKIVLIPLTLITVLSTVMMPRIANEFKKGNKSNVNNYVTKSGEFSLFMAVPLTIGIGSIATGLIPWYLGNEFIPSSYAIIILSPLIIFNAMTGVFSNQYFTATNQIGYITKSYFIAAALNIILNIFLIPQIGFKGAAISTLISSGVSFGVQYYYINKQINMKKMWSIFIKYLLYSLPMLISVLVIGINFEISFVITLLQITVGIIVYILVLYLLKDKIFNEIKKIFKKYF